jgi:hypothetical protein
MHVQLPSQVQPNGGGNTVASIRRNSNKILTESTLNKILYNLNKLYILDFNTRQPTRQAKIIIQCSDFGQETKYLMMASSRNM